MNSADAALEVLARDYDRNTIGRVRVSDSQLLSLRDAFERIGEDEQRTVGRQVGRNIELRAFSYDDSRSRGMDLAQWHAPPRDLEPTASSSPQEHPDQSADWDAQ